MTLGHNLGLLMEERAFRIVWWTYIRFGIDDMGYVAEWRPLKKRHGDLT